MKEKGLLKDVFAEIEKSLAKLTEKVNAARDGAALEDLNLAAAGLMGADETAGHISRLCQTVVYLHRCTTR